VPCAGVCAVPGNLLGGAPLALQIESAISLTIAIVGDNP